MPEPCFFPSPQPVTLGEVAELVGADLPRPVDLYRQISGVAPLDRAGPGDATFFDNTRYLPALGASRAAACFTRARLAAQVPAHIAVLVVADPHRALALLSRKLHPEALKPASVFGTAGVAPGAIVHPTARLEPGVTVDPGAVVGADVEIGTGTCVAANAVVGQSVRVGRDCWIGPGASVTHALLGNRVIVHGGVRVGQDGFGYVMGPRGHLKVPQLGRVIIQDDVEIGANSTIDRGAGGDTVIGEGTKIDNLVQIAHNVTIGRNCVIVAQVGISGSATLGDFVVIGGQAGVIGHVNIGDGAQIAATSSVKDDVPPGARWGGAPAKPVRAWFREVTLLAKLAAQGEGDRPAGKDEGGET
ncbi:UDP-3-O-(3-hydroxymyristoyl)glucosamine N-acyltransferase [Blastochloris sulfoviridis]|uniref:UDP-3-O-acylglucosamine N-acyltransferase n=1 Tax=Blastochloris sulfoviridis TaxID=50712 RepID=A0A5M6HZQ2_9HYPH|nr:UDP-3-O-(3-hydroxymyristoyl)glucosamine N-acyltransferase [Blastochloris sulfoviridis]KAA5601107.1 UDP-3-O-(3-hydroxymyristoyl)glucosamine N-acyltransferase [Blastochloris sulfoviridis]